MKKLPIVAGALAILLLFVLARGRPERAPVDAPPMATALPRPDRSPATEGDQGFLYGRVLTLDGATYEGRLRWGGDDEAFWGDVFQGFEDENPWAALLPPELRTVPRPIEVFGIEIARLERPKDLGRPFVARFGDIAHIEARVRDIRVRLKSGTLATLDRFAADDLADGLRVWDAQQGVVDIEERRIRRVDFLPTAHLEAAPLRLQGRLRTRQGEFSGFIQWDWGKRVETDLLQGEGPDGEVVLGFEQIRSIARQSRDSALLRLDDGRQIELSGPELGAENRGTFVEDPRYGRVLVDWENFERVDFQPGGSGPAYDGFPPGRALTGSLTTRDGRRLAGRLVFDLDEAESTELLDAPAEGGLHYSIPFGKIASIQVHDGEATGASPVRLSLHGGEVLHLERAGDLGPENAGILVFQEGREQPDYLPWAEVASIDLEAPPGDL